MTNYEKIKAINVEKMAEFLANARFSCEYGCNAQDIW